MGLFIVGNGGHASVVASVLRLTNLAFRFLPHHSEVYQYKPEEVILFSGVGSLGAREDVYVALSNRGYRIIGFQHPHSWVAPGLDIGRGAQIMAGAVVQTGTKIGENVLINTHASVDHDCNIGAHVHIAPGAIVCGGVTIGDGAFIGAGAVVVENRTVPPGAFVKAGSVFS